MANFLLVVDPDADRRAAFVRTTEAELSPFTGLVSERRAAGDFVAVWARGPRAPVSHAGDAAGAAILWGEAVRKDGTRLEACRMDRLPCAPDAMPPEPLGGYHAAAAYGAESGLTLGGDLLGLFPIYYQDLGDVLLAGSSSELFGAHPLSRGGLDHAGLVGILLLSHLVGGRTLLPGVRRLAPGHLLRWRRGQPAVEIPHFRLPVSAAHFDLPFAAQVDMLDEVLVQAVARHAPPGPHGLLLSGGRDSRMLAGLLRRQGTEVAALTLGLPPEVEMRCARLVARALDVRHLEFDVAAESYAGCAGQAARWEHLAAGFNDLTNWGLRETLDALPPRCVSGYTMDAVVGGSHIAWAYSPDSQTMSFERFFSLVNRSGLRPEVLRRLLRREVFGDLVADTLSQIRATYAGYASLESQRAWCFDLHHRQRFHVGRSLWPLSFGAWPVVPTLDRDLLAACGGLPASTLAERRAQDEILCQRFPELAALPLDRNSYDTAPLRPRLRHLAAQHIRTRLRFLRRARPFASRRVERRYYYRVFDINGPGWRAIRREAEPLREKLLDLFDRAALEELLPPPEAVASFEDPILGPSGMKLLLGLLLWLRDHG
jgi:asparagine synthase (glutamine-hydrolysing)